MTAIEKRKKNMFQAAVFSSRIHTIPLPMITMECHLNCTWIIVHFRVDGISGTSFTSRLKICRISCFLLYGQNTDSDSERGYHNSLNTENFNTNLVH
jgi:hypothetical protein